MALSILEPESVLKVWGGERLARWFGRSWDGAVGEALLCYIRNNRSNRIIAGYGAGLTLLELAHRKTNILGKFSPEEFPIICKLIAPVNANLSVQVHPDRQHLANPSDEPKEEVWYVVEVTRRPAIVAGLKVAPSHFLFAEDKRRLLDFLDSQPADVLHIPAGAIHSLLAGNTVFEVSTNSETTYRLWDWDRKERTLHVEEAVNAATGRKVEPINGAEQNTPYGLVTRFDVGFCLLEQHDAISGQVLIETRNRFAVLVVLWGTFSDGRHALSRGVTALVHAHTRINLAVASPGRLLLVRPQ